MNKDREQVLRACVRERRLVVVHFHFKTEKAYFSVQTKLQFFCGMVSAKANTAPPAGVVC